MLKSKEPVALDGGWYEEQLAHAERRRRGHYSTPAKLVGPDARLGGLSRRG